MKPIPDPLKRTRPPPSVSEKTLAEMRNALSKSDSQWSPPSDALTETAPKVKPLNREPMSLLNLLSS